MSSMTQKAPKGIYRAVGGRHGQQAMATGEFRPPRKGEWYLSGAIIEAYRAPNDLTTPYYIAHLIESLA